MKSNKSRGKKRKRKQTDRLEMERQPKMHENVKKAILIKAIKTSPTICDLISYLGELKKPHIVKYKERKNLIPFEDISPLEHLSSIHDCGLFVYGSSSKKHPHRLVLGRMHNHHILDMIELNVVHYHVGSVSSKTPLENFKPCFAFVGSEFEHQEQYSKLKNIIVDFFRGPVVENVNLVGLGQTHVLSMTVDENSIHFKIFTVSLKKNSNSSLEKNLPRVELEDTGFSMIFSMCRTHFASESFYESACKQPDSILKSKKVKNVDTNAFKQQLGSVHVRGQNIEGMGRRQMKGLNKNKGGKGKGGK